MKSYLLIPLFFLSVLSVPISVSSQENREGEHSQTTESLPSSDSIVPEKQEDELINSPNPAVDIPVTWSDQMPRESDTFQTKFFNMLFILGLLIGFMILASWALKRMMRSKMTQLNTASNIKLLETRYLSPRATLHLVEVQNQVFLIAESPTNVTYLSTLPLEEESTPSPSLQAPPSFPPR